MKRWHPNPRCRLALLLAALSGAAGATSLPPLDDSELVRRADTIVVGQARGAESVWVGRNLYTRYAVEVQETLMGTPVREVAVVVEGGVDMNRKHPIVVTVVDAPMLHRDEPVLLLLARGSALGDDAHHIVGFNQGRIRLPAASGEAGADRAPTPWRSRLQEAIARRGAAAAAPSVPSSGASRPAVRRHTTPIGGFQR